MDKKLYITTPIYYPSAKLTLGNCYTTIVCDAISRFHKMMGYDVFFLTGTDEHGQKIEKVAKEKGVTEMEHLDAIVADTKQLWKALDIDYNKFIRTTDKHHIKLVEEVYDKLFKQGDIYLSELKTIPIQNPTHKCLIATVFKIARNWKQPK